ncbi:MAG: cysteine desulfurase family protein [Eubacteriales bacterium]|nr:cysteine desulfurase family protein [Eubacteriales bacterium]
MKCIYLDNASTTKPSTEAKNAAINAFDTDFGNPSSRHTLGFNAEKLVKNARGIIAEKLSVSPSEITFTSCGSESNNMAILGSLTMMRTKGRIITSKIEHKSVLNIFKQLENEGYDVKYIGCDSKGIINMDELSDSLNDNTLLVSIIHVNNEVGSIQPINDIYRIVKEKSKAIFHTDSVQGFCKIPDKFNADLISVSAHKIGGLKGCGALYIKKGIRIKPFIIGGGQENDLRSGTENVPGISAFGAAVDGYNSKERYNYVDKLNEEMRKINVGEILSSDNCSPYILSIGFEGLKSEVLLNALAMRGIYVSSGSACASNHPELSHVLTAMAIRRNLIDSSIRISFSHELTIEDIVEARTIIEEEATKLIKIMKVRR